MKHITFGDKSLLVGDEVADTLLEYAALQPGNNLVTPSKLQR